MKKFILFFAILGMAFTSCQKDETPEESAPYEVNITIVRPEAGQINMTVAPVGIEVNFERGPNEIIHFVKIEVLDSDGNLVETLLDEHAHVEGSYSYLNDQGFTANEKGEYTLRASSSDMEGNEVTPVEVNFFAQ